MRNKSRGEVILSLDGREFTLRPSFEIMEMVEDATGQSAPALISEMATGLPRFGHVVTILYVAAVQNKDNPKSGTRAEFGQAVKDMHGLIPAARIASDFLLKGIASAEDIENALAEAEEKSKDPDPKVPPPEEAEANTDSPTE